MRRTPKGYRGINHETIGSDVLAVLRTLKLPDQILGATTADQLRKIDPLSWYPIATLLELMETMDQKVGTFGMLQLGRTLFQMSHEERIREVANSGRDIVYGIDGMYKHANRGLDIGGWTVLSFSPGRAELEKNTPHHCVMEEGILLQALDAMGVPANIRQQQCFRKGAETCHYLITSYITDKRWSGK
jgi:hypothetical protein